VQKVAVTFLGKAATCTTPQPTKSPIIIEKPLIYSVYSGIVLNCWMKRLSAYILVRLNAKKTE